MKSLNEKMNVVLFIKLSEGPKGIESGINVDFIISFQQLITAGKH